ncbi:MAG: DUF4062 domain-containing protein [Actinomycetota bacterium]|nr:DUF4062 domain-containing protein [Actinomycetota bacterium]
MTIIRTPDQRLRVFVSSTLQELAPERAAAQRAIARLHLSPILFELGARPHPPRELYQAYLEQSHVFVGIYWQRYGWIAPGMDVSGLEDEYLLALDKPKLIYVKAPAPERDEGLGGLLGRIKADSGVSYKPFSDASELEQLIENDLALLLTEQFETARLRGETATGAVIRGSDLPARVDHFVGRHWELDHLCELLTERRARLLTLTGPGGVGKSRLGIELASRCRDAFEDGVHFVPLGSITEPDLVAPTILASLNVQGSTSEPLDAVIEHLRNRELLLFLDNFEQVLVAASDVARLVEECERLSTVVTSRAILNIRREHEFAVLPLALPETDTVAPEALTDYEAVRLFVDRARAINHDFRLSHENAAEVAKICRRLDGLPLALELAAARIRLLSPAAMLERLDASLQLLTGGSRDLPERHQTLRAAIDWSFGLLDDDEKKLFTRLGVFRGGCTLEAAEEVCNAARELDLLDLMTSLLEKSLIKHVLHQGEPRFSMLQTVWEYASDLLDRGSEAEQIRAAHAEHYLALIEASYTGLRSSGQIAWMSRLEADDGNLRAALRWCLDHGDTERVAEAGWILWLFWWINAHLAEGRRVMEEAIERDGLSDIGRAKATAVEGVMAFWMGDYTDAIPLLTSAVEMMRDIGFDAGVALCQLPLGFVDSALGDAAAAEARYAESIRLFKEMRDEWGTVLALNAFSWMAIANEVDIGDEVFEEGVERARRLGTELDYGMALRNWGGRRARTGHHAEAKELLGRALEMLWRGYIRGGSSYTIDGLAELAADEGRHVLATRLFAAIDGVRATTGSPIIPMFVPRMTRYLDELRAALGSEAFEREWAFARDLGLDATARAALAWARGEEVDPLFSGELVAPS